MLRAALLGVGLLLVAGCSSLSSWTGGVGLSAPSAKGPDGVACVGDVPAAQRGMVEEKNERLLSEADDVTGAGGICAGKTFKVTEPVRVFRVIDANRGSAEYGRWWSLNHPGSSRERYREANAICPEWSQLNQLISCNIRPGTAVVIGTTQSASCGKAAYPKSGTLQVYIENNEWDEVLYMDDCKDEGAWPN